MHNICSFCKDVDVVLKMRYIFVYFNLFFLQNVTELLRLRIQDEEKEWKVSFMEGYRPNGRPVFFD